MKLYGLDKKEMLNVSKIETRNGEVIIKGKIYGTMPLVAVLRPQEARAALKLLDLKIVAVLFAMLFRRSKK